MTNETHEQSKFACCVEMCKKNPFATLTAVILFLLLLLVYLPWPYSARVVDQDGRVIELVEGTRDLEVTSLAIGTDILWAGTRYSGLLPIVKGQVSKEDFGVSTIDGAILSLFLTDLHLWGAAGEAGLFILAGKEVQKPRVPFGLQGLTVTSLAIGEDKMWIGTDQGLLSYNLSTWSTYLMKGRKQPLKITSLLAQNSKLWVGTEEGLYTFDKDWSAIPLGGAGAVQVFTLKAAPSGGLYCGSQNGLAFISKTGTVTLVEGVETPVRALATKQETVWAGGEGGLFRGTGAGPFTKVTGLQYDKTASLAVDEEKLWVGTDRGLFSYELVPSKKPRGAGAGEPAKVTPGGPPANPWQTPGRPVQAFQLPEEFAKSQTFFVKADEQRNRVWLGTERGAFLYGADGTQLARFSKDNGLPDDKVHVIDIGADGKTWFGTMGGLAMLSGDSWTTYRKTEGGLLDNNVWALLATEVGTFVGTDGGLQLLDNDGRWSSWTIKNSPLPENWIQAITQDSKGTIYVAIWNGGVGRYSNGAWDIFSDPDGLPDEDQRSNDGVLTDAVTSVVVDGNDHLWVGTTRGLCRFDGRRWFDYTHPNWGLVNAPINYLEMAPDNRTLVINGSDGFSLLDGQKWRTYKTMPGAGPSIRVREGTVRNGMEKEYFLGQGMSASYVWSAAFLGRNLILGLSSGSATLVY